MNLWTLWGDSLCRFLWFYFLHRLAPISRLCHSPLSLLRISPTLYRYALLLKAYPLSGSKVFLVVVVMSKSFSLLNLLLQSYPPRLNFHETTHKDTHTLLSGNYWCIRGRTPLSRSEEHT